MLSFDQVADMLDALAETFPPEFYAQLNGGISLLPEEKRNLEHREDLYILGEYFHNEMGRYIQLYYGSFAATCGRMTQEELVEQLRVVLAHELTHHMESLSGERELERKDAETMARYLAAGDQ